MALLLLLPVPSSLPRTPGRPEPRAAVAVASVASPRRRSITPSPVPRAVVVSGRVASSPTPPHAVAIASHPRCRAARRRRRDAIATRREPSPSRCCAFEPRALSLPRRSTVAVGLAP
uniref:Uncharacterized protein K0063H06.26 n=1 Tax=Oryza sativa subsp. indica TaxID=39946 RepID=C8TF22_ORYSI|nr:hypothetical protein [Oryza sativa Indica Group]